MAECSQAAEQRPHGGGAIPADKFASERFPQTRGLMGVRPSVEVIWENFAKCFTKNAAYGRIVRRLNIFRITVWRNTQEAEGAPLLRV